MSKTEDRYIERRVGCGTILFYIIVAIVALGFLGQAGGSLE